MKIYFNIIVLICSCVVFASNATVVSAQEITKIEITTSLSSSVASNSASIKKDPPVVLPTPTIVPTLPVSQPPLIATSAAVISITPPVVEKVKEEPVILHVTPLPKDPTTQTSHQEEPTKQETDQASDSHVNASGNNELFHQIESSPPYTLPVFTVQEKNHEDTIPPPTPASHDNPASPSPAPTNVLSVFASLGISFGEVFLVSVSKIFPVTGNRLFFFALIANILMFLFGAYLRLRSGRSPGYMQRKRFNFSVLCTIGSVQ